MNPVVGLLVAELFISDALTLKDRRRVVRSLIDRLANRLNVSVADLGPDHRPHNATLAVSTVSNDRKQVDRVLQAALRAIEAEPRAVCEHSEISLL